MFRRAIAAALVGALLATPIESGTPQLDPEEVALRTESLPPELRLEIFGLQYLLSGDEITDLLAYQSEHRIRRWIENWWETRDPVYTSVENENRLEFQTRVSNARLRFRKSAYPGWDQRGEVLIRYGEPAWRYEIKPDVTVVGYDRPGELWYYPAHRMYVSFEDAFASGEYTYMIKRVKLPARQRPRSDRLQAPSRYLGDYSLDARTLDAAFNAMLSGHPTDGPDAQAMVTYDDFWDQLLNFQDMLESTPATFPSDFDLVRIPTYHEVDCFRGGEGVDRVDVNAQFEADARAAHAGMEERKYVTTAVFWNTDGEEVSRNVTTIAVPLVEAEADTVALVVAQLSFTLPPDFYHAALTVEEFGTGRFQSIRSDVTCRDFEGRLTISDVVFAGRIAPARSASPFNRGALYVRPHPLRRYRQGEAVPVYFEVYNLQLDRDGQASYTVSYRLTARSPRPAGFFGRSGDDAPLDVASQFSSRSAGPYDVVDITLRSGNLWPGEYVLEVEITDDVSNAQTSREATFAIEE